MNHTELIDILWVDYCKKSPYVKKVYDLLIEQGENVINDHIAFRTFNLPEINISVLSIPIINAGYEEKGSFVFEEKKLIAKHFKHKHDPNAPLIIISELMVQRFSSYLQNTVKRLVKEIPINIIASDNLIFLGNNWGKPSFEVYEQLRSESEYAAWVYVNGFTANHFTVSVNHLKKFNSIYQLNDFLKSKGFLMNNPEQEVQGSPEELLEQSSIKAELKKVEFIEGTFEVTSCYYEFTKRYKNSKGELFSGFIAKSADKIFQSTDLYVKN